MQKKEKTMVTVTIKNLAKEEHEKKLREKAKKRQAKIDASPYACSENAEKVAREASKRQIEDLKGK